MNWHYVYTGDSLTELSKKLDEEYQAELAAKKLEEEKHKAQELEMAQLVSQQKAQEAMKRVSSSSGSQKEWQTINKRILTIPMMQKLEAILAAEEKEVKKPKDTVVTKKGILERLFGKR